MKSRRIMGELPSAAAVRTGVRKFATDENVGAVGLDPLVVQFALGN
jgi:hypothetical protein